MNNDVVGRIIDLRKERNWTQKDLAERMGINKVTMNKIERGNRNVTNEELLKFAEIFNVSTDYLLRGNKTNAQTNTIPYDPNDMVDIPVVGTIKCGINGLSMFDYQGKESVNGNDLEKGFEYFWLVTSGDSMIGDGIRNGDYALIRKQSNFENGDICAIVVDGEEGTLKHITKDSSSIVLTASNTDIPPRVFVGENMNDVFIAGKLIRMMRKY